MCIRDSEYIVAQANEPLDENNHFVRPRVSGRHRNDIQEFDASQAVSYTHLDVYKRQVRDALERHGQPDRIPAKKEQGQV